MFNHNPSILPSWPRFIKGARCITVTGRHQTPASKKLAENLAGLLMLAVMVNSFFFQYSVVNRSIATVVKYFRPDWDLSSIYGWLFFLGFLVLPFVALLICQPLLSLLLSKRTTVWFFADRLEVRQFWLFRRRFYWAGVPNIQFVNTCRLDGITVVHTPEQGTNISSDESNLLHLHFGFNQKLIARFLTAEKAHKFAIVCNAAVACCWTRTSMAAGMVTITEVHEVEVIPFPKPRAQLREAREVKSLPGQARAALEPGKRLAVRRRNQNP
jgi:hypothetical protein